MKSIRVESIGFNKNYINKKNFMCHNQYKDQNKETKFSHQKIKQCFGILRSENKENENKT